MERDQKNKSLLIVDDNIINRMAIRILLERNGYNIEEADDGVEVISLVKNKNYEIILIDVEMPIIDGIECTRILRSEQNYSGTIIGITSHADLETHCDCKKVGMNEVISKPITEKSLIQCIENILTK